MKPRYLALGIAVAIVAGLAVYAVTRPPAGDDGAAPTTNTPAAATPMADSNATTGQTATVDIVGRAFSPAKLTVKKGATVTWKNSDTIEHDVVTDSPNAATGPKSNLLSAGQSYSFTFTTVGTYHYHCTPHPFMQGEVIVVE